MLVSVDRSLVTLLYVHQFLSLIEFLAYLIFISLICGGLENLLLKIQDNFRSIKFIEYQFVIWGINKVGAKEACDTRRGVL